MWSVPVDFDEQAVKQSIRQAIAEHPVLLYMKGTPQFPQCGYSARVVQILKSYGVDFASVNILENPDIRATLPKVSDWPTFPQLFVNHELVGGCDIVVELHENGELKTLLEAAK